jgi:CRP/FNR family transcriptional regulator
MQRDPAGKITTTHHELAIQPGSVREVISRHLKRFEMNGWLQLGRGTIQVKLPDQLARFKEN